MENNKVFGAYPGSLIAQNYAEGDNNFHGYIMWDISGEEPEYEFISVENKYSFKNVIVNQFTDFDDLDIEIENPTEFMRVRIIWECYRAQHTTENLNKIKAYLNSKYNVIEIKNKKSFLNEETLKVDENSLKIDKITTKETQEKIFRDYLAELGFEDDFVNEVIDLDHVITSRLGKQEDENLSWRILKLKGTNFRSYKNFEINLADLTGILQITGKNQTGKTTAYSLLSYILYLKTAETETRQKNGDNRFINNRVDDNFCSGDVVFEANNEYYGARRISTQKWSKDKSTLKAVNTTFELYKLNSPDDEFSDINNIENLNKEDRTKTQGVIDKITGDYDNFNRLVLTTSDSLNKILSLNKAEFIDNILFNLGLDFFDKKITEYKDYKKEYYTNNPKINLNIEESNKTIDSLKDVNNSEKTKIKTLIKEIDKTNKRRSAGKDYKENLIKTLHQIDQEIFNTDINELNVSIKNNNDSIDKKRNELKTNRKKIKELPNKFDEEKINALKKEYDTFKDKIYSKKDEIGSIKETQNEIGEKINKLKTKIFLNEKAITEINKEIDLLNHSKTCPTCKQILRPEDVKEIQKKIKIKKEEIPVLENGISDHKKGIVEYEKVNSNHSDSIEKIKEEIVELNINIENLLINISEEENIKKKYDEKILLEHKNEKIILEGEKLKNDIEKLELRIQLYNSNLTNIEENKNIQIKIDEADKLLTDLDNEVFLLNKNVSDIENNIKNNLNSINTIEKNIVAFKTQQRNDQVMNIYEECVHRDGIPTMLLKKYSIPEINKNLEILLQEIPFNVWMDKEDLSLKMSDITNSDAVIDCLSGSGKERTFSAIALKFCLNELNIKSKPSLIILDEVTGKLVDESIDEFNDILNKLKKHVHNVIVIEHVHDIQPDHYIKVAKNNKGISEIVEIN